MHENLLYRARDTLDLNEVANQLRKRGYSDNMIKTIQLTLQDTGIPPTSYQEIYDKVNFSSTDRAELAKELEKLRRGELSTNRAPVFQRALKELNISPDRLQFHPRPSMEEITGLLSSRP